MAPPQRGERLAPEVGGRFTFSLMEKSLCREAPAAAGHLVAVQVRQGCGTGCVVSGHCSWQPSRERLPQDAGRDGCCGPVSRVDHSPTPSPHFAPSHRPAVNTAPTLQHIPPRVTTAQLLGDPLCEAWPPPALWWLWSVPMRWGEAEDLHHCTFSGKSSHSLNATESPSGEGTTGSGRLCGHRASLALAAVGLGPPH